LGRLLHIALWLFFARRPPRCSSTLQYQGSRRSFPRLWICSGHALFPS
jgi:hypothetical protein